MTEMQIILALEAILCAAEGHFKGDALMYETLCKIEKVVERKLNASYLGKEGQFKNFLDEQNKALKILVEIQDTFEH